MRDYVLAIAGASLAAARELAEGRSDVSICWDGGRCVALLPNCVYLSLIYFVPPPTFAFVSHGIYLMTPMRIRLCPFCMRDATTCVSYCMAP